MSHGSFTDADSTSGQVRVTAWCNDSVPGVIVSIAVGQVADELVMIWRPVSRSNHALFRIPWWPCRRRWRIRR